MRLSSPHKLMDKYISRFTTETGCQLDLEKGPTGICFMAMAEDGQCVGRRYLSTTQLANSVLVEAVMLDFISQTKRVLEPGDKCAASNIYPCEDGTGSMPEQ